MGSHGDHMKKVALFFFRPWLGAGSTTFTAHLYQAFKMCRYSPSIYRVMDVDHPFDKPFGDFPEIKYRCVSMPTARSIVSGTPSLMTAIAKAPIVRDGVIDDLMALGMRAVIHDSNEAADFDWSKAKKPICIRKAVTALVPGSIWLPQPYVRQMGIPTATRSGAVSIARIAPSKRTDIILKANRILAPENRIALLGAEFRIYSKQLAVDYKDVFTRAPKAGMKFPLDLSSAAKSCATALFNVDMSWFAKDGGGTQYAQLEAMDAGAVNIMNADWFRFDGDLKAGKHAISVASETGLADAVMHTDSALVDQIRSNSYKLLNAHGPRLGRVYMQALGG